MTRTPAQMDAHRETMRQRSRQLSATSREIGAIPPTVDPDRKSRGLSSYQSFCDEYFPNRFGLPWGVHHHKLIERIQGVIVDGGLHAVAMPRGEGKTTIVEPAPIWAAIRGDHAYIFLVGNSETKAQEMLESIKMELLYNERLYEDFPEVCYPIRKLEGQALRATGQLHYGQRTEMKWGPDEIRLPTIPGSPASGTTIKVAGLTGNIRGAVKTLADGRRVRPTLVIVDDPQTDESARSPAQCEKRHRIIQGSILGLAGAGDSISALMPCTVIEEDDLSDRMLNRDQSPEWTGERTSLVINFPTNEDLWDDYAQLRVESLEKYDDARLANAFYKKNRKKMDAGAEVSWPARYDAKKGELSAIQFAMNLKLRDERAFYSEYQNQPLPDVPADSLILSVEEIRAKTNNHERGLVPFDAQVLVGHIDVQHNALYYMLCAFWEGFSGAIVDYGAFPKQRRDYFTLDGIKSGLSQRYPDRGYEGQLFAGLNELIEDLSRAWKLDGGGTMRPSLMLIDAAYGRSTDTVFEVCRKSDHAANILPAFGQAVGASKKPFSEYQKRRGETLGLNWRIPTISRKRTTKHLLYDTNFWKSFAHSRLSTPQGESGSVELFKPGKSPTAHRMLAEQLTAEQRVETEGRGRRVDEWFHPDKSRDNHLFDNFVGCHVAASVRGITMREVMQEKKRGPRKTLSQIQQQKRGIAS